MREMKNSIVPGIERIPSAWEVVPLKSKFSFGKGLSITKSDLVESGIPVLSYGQIHSKKNKRTTIDDSLLRFVPKWKTLSSPDSRAIQNGFIFADTSEDRDGCGNCNYVDKDGLYAGYHTIVLKPKTNENWKYLGYLFQTDAWRYQFRRDLTEVKLYSVSQKILKNSYIFVPPKEERAAIADFLDKKCAEIDSLTADVQKEIETLQEYRRSLITEAVTKGLNLDAELKDSGIPWIGKIPQNASIGRIKNGYNIVLGKMVNKGNDSAYGDNYLCAANLKWNGVNTEINRKMIFTESEKRLYLLKKNDVLIMEGGATAGTTCVYNEEFSPCYIQNSVIRCRPKTGFVSVFLYYWMVAINHFGYIDQVKSVATMPHFTKEKVAATPLILFPFEDQCRIVNFLDQRCAEVNSVIEIKQKQLDALAEYRKSLIYEYVTGKKEVV